jgi:hypothetical protein
LPLTVCLAIASTIYFNDKQRAIFDENLFLAPDGFFCCEQTLGSRARGLRSKPLTSFTGKHLLKGVSSLLGDSEGGGGRKKSGGGNKVLTDLT